MIQFTADGKDYKLEVTASTLKQMERAGVNFKQIGNKVTGDETLWKGLFIAHHNTVPDSKRMEIYRALSATEDGSEPQQDDDGEVIDELMEAVANEYLDAIKALKRGQGNLSWKRN